MEKCQRSGGEARIRKLPLEADRAELLRATPGVTRHRPTLLTGGNPGERAAEKGFRIETANAIVEFSVSKQGTQDVGTNSIMARSAKLALRSTVFETLRDAILRGTLPNSTPPREEMLAREPGVSLSPVREVLHRLLILSLGQRESFRKALLHQGHRRPIRRSATVETVGRKAGCRTSDAASPQRAGASRRAHDCDHDPTETRSDARTTTDDSTCRLPRRGRTRFLRAKFSRCWVRPMPSSLVASTRRRRIARQMRSIVSCFLRLRL